MHHLFGRKAPEEKRLRKVREGKYSTFGICLDCDVRVRDDQSSCMPCPLNMAGSPDGCRCKDGYCSANAVVNSIKWVPLASVGLNNLLLPVIL